MNLIKDELFGGERPLFAVKDTRLEHITIVDGESGIKFCRNLEADNCSFYGKYPWWHVDGSLITNCYFAVFWKVNGLKVRGLTLHDGTYPFMFCENVDVDGLESDSKYVFQYVKNAVIRNSRIVTKDAFWETENVTIYDSTLDGEYLGWHSKNLKLVRCHIAGEQPLCYIDGLTLEDCTFDAACDRCFEDTVLDADIKGDITNIKNPRSGSIRVRGKVGSITIDSNILPPADCKITEI